LDGKRDTDCPKPQATAKREGGNRRAQSEHTLDKNEAQTMTAQANDAYILLFIIASMGVESEQGCRFFEVSAAKQHARWFLLTSRRERRRRRKSNGTRNDMRSNNETTIARNNERKEKGKKEQQNRGWNGSAGRFGRSLKRRTPAVVVLPHCLQEACYVAAVAWFLPLQLPRWLV